MNIEAEYMTLSAYLKAANLQGRAWQLTIADCRMEHFDDESKPLLLFAGTERGLILNKTNAGILVNAFGPETDAWRGRVVELYPDRVMFAGRIVDAIRVRIPQAGAASSPAAPAPTPAQQHAASLAFQAPSSSPAPAPVQGSEFRDIPF